jgi:hypothetical protein
MDLDDKLDRRKVIAAGVGLLAAIPALGETLNPDEGVTAPEDLMKEHGVLNATLKTQHVAGRGVTAEILRLAQPASFHVAANRAQLVGACQSFIRMYRPHEAREDTVLFPALRTILSAKQVAALGDRMEEDEQKVLGKEGFERSVEKVATIETQLGINDLKQFTPHA